ncbi:MAG: response regulator [Bacteroidales bacterium]|nr:response regulator [Bacteroidales bacterium]
MQKILIVEDDFMSFKLFKARLHNTGYTLLHASDGLSAIEIFKKDPDISLIIMDLQLPYMNGLEVTREIRKLDENIPVIAATANVSGDGKTAAEKAGCTHYVTKPIDFSVLNDLLKRHLG